MMMKCLFFALSLVTLTSSTLADGIDSWYRSNACDRTAYLSNLSQQYQLCIAKIPGCSEECIKSYAKGLSQTDCASPSDMEVVVEACKKSCPSSPLCSLPKLQCAYPVAGHSCENYKTCVENVKSCGTDGYALGFGYKYCSAYLNRNDNFSSKGKLWAKNVRICLQQAFINQDVSTMTCDQISNYAVGTHFNCYSKLGYPAYCDLTFWDRVVVSATAASALLSSRFLSIAKQAFQVNAACLVPGFFSVDGKAQPDMLTVRITWDVSRQTLATTFNDDTLLQSTIQSFITRMESSIITSYPSLPSNATLLFGNLYGTNTNTTLDVLINLNRASNITVDIYAIASYLQTQLISGGIPSPYTVVDVRSAQNTNTPTETPSTTEPRNIAHITAPTIIVLAIVGFFHQLFQ